MRTRFFNLRVPERGNQTVLSELLVEDGLILDILPAGMETAAGDERWVDGAGALVLPGAVDAAVRFCDPGASQRENFATGTLSAAAGGITCAGDLASGSGGVADTDSLGAKLQVIAAKAAIDYALWASVDSSLATSTTGLSATVGELAEAGVCGLELDLKEHGQIDGTLLRRVLATAREHDLPVLLRAEDPSVVSELTERVRAREEGSPRLWAQAHPATVQVAAVATALEACRATGARLHFTRVSAGEAVDLISAARFEGLPVSVDTCPHFLAFTSAELTRKGALAKTEPALQTDEDVDRLWQGLASGEITSVTSGHDPAVWPDEKRTGSIWEDRAGFPATETLLPYLLSEGVGRRRVTLQRVVELVSLEPARLLGVDDRKGTLRPGADADLVLVDDQQSWLVRASELHCLNRFTPFEGLTLGTRVLATYVRGRCVFQREPDGSEMFAPRGAGALVARRRAL